MPNNRHRIDLLADIRAEIKLLREREAELRAEVLATGDTVGDEFEAVISEMAIERIDLEKLRREMGTRFVEPFLRKQVATRVQIKPRR
jgi:hypothetical protein